MTTTTNAATTSMTGGHASQASPTSPAGSRAPAGTPAGPRAGQAVRRTFTAQYKRAIVAESKAEVEKGADRLAFALSVTK